MQTLSGKKVGGATMSVADAHASGIIPAIDAALLPPSRLSLAEQVGATVLLGSFDQPDSPRRATRLDP